MCVACGGGIVEMKARNWFFPREKVCEWRLKWVVDLKLVSPAEVGVNLGKVGNVSCREGSLGNVVFI